MTAPGLPTVPTLPDSGVEWSGHFSFWLTCQQLLRRSCRSQEQAEGVYQPQHRRWQPLSLALSFLPGPISISFFLCVCVCVCVCVRACVRACLFRAAPKAQACGGSQARGLNRSYSWRPQPQPQPHGIRAEIAHGNAGSLTHWARPGIEPVSSWMPVRCVFAEP